MSEVKLVEKIPVNSSFIIFRFECPPDFEAFPGQFVLVNASIDDGSSGRHYSISSPFVRDSFEIIVAVEEDGTVSSWLAEREPGDMVEVHGPFGQNYFEGGYPVVVLASGPGIGAALGIAKRAAASKDEFSVLFKNPTRAFECQLSQLAMTGQPVVYIRHNLTTGIAEVLNDGQVYVFGFQEFITEVESALSVLEVPVGEVKFENFG